MKQEFLVALGGNLPSRAGDPTKTLLAALTSFSVRGLVIRSVSRFFKTPCFPPGAGPDYVNAAVAIVSDLSSAEVLEALHAIEADFDRQRQARWGQRTLDLDLLAAGGTVLPNPGTWNAWRDLSAEEQRIRSPDELIIPHPRLSERGFVLVPLCDIAPDWVHPVSGETVAQMCAKLPSDEIRSIIPVETQ